MTLLLALPSAHALTICVPEIFQHWSCDQAQSTLQAAYAAVDAVAGPHTIHLRWSVNAGTLLELDADDDITIIGHPGPTPRTGPDRPEYPRIQQIRLTDSSRLTLRQIEMYVPNDTVGLTQLGAGGNASVATLGRVWFVSQAPTTSTNQPMVLLTEDAQLTATNTHWTAATSSIPGPHLQVEGTATASLDRSDLTGGTGTKGGSVFIAPNATLTTERTLFTDNTATDKGGGAVHLEAGTFNAYLTTFDTNDTTEATNKEGGGAIAAHTADGATISIVEGLFCQNHSDSDGGAIFKRKESDLTVTRSVFYGNTAVSQGAAHYSRDDADNGSFSIYDRVSGNGNRSDGNNDDGFYVDAYGDSDSDTFDHLTVRESILEARDDSYWQVEGGLVVDDSRFTQDDVRLSTDGTESGNLYNSTPAYDGDACSFEAFTLPCSDLQAVDHVLGAVLSCSTPDGDNDGLMDHEEVARGTDPLRDDTDGDGIPDGVECPPALTDPLTNPGFEDAPTATFSGGTSDVNSADVPGWIASDGQLRLVDTSSWPGLSGQNALQLQVGQEVTQRLRAEPGEPLVFRARLHNSAPVQATLGFQAYDEATGPVGGDTDFPVSVGQTELAEVPLTMPADGGVLVVRLLTAGAALDIDDVYLGPNSDSDSDGVLDCHATDSDGDGVDDAVELGVSDPTLPDTDGDGDNDAEADPMVADLDGDGLSDHFEETIGTDPANPDSDGDGVEDGEECQDAGVVNGSFEYRFGAPLPAEGGAPYSPAELPGWTASPSAQYYLGAALTNQWPDAAAGDYVALLQTTSSNRYEQALTGLPAGDYHWVFSHRGRYDMADLTFTISDSGGSFAMSYAADDLGWETQTGMFTTDGSPLTLTFEGVPSAQSYLDGIALYPASSVTLGGTLYCNDPTEQPVFDSDGDGSNDDVDCAPNDASIYPGATEICNGIDDDCDGNTDNGVSPLYTHYLDADTDDWGGTIELVSCDPVPPTGYVDAQHAGDCDDTNAAFNPGANEVCDNADNDCDGDADEGLPTHVYYLDGDGDGWGVGSVSIDDCALIPPSGYAAQLGDCDDAAPLVFPMQPEICNGLDDDCDGDVDDGLMANTYYADSDGDGYGDPTTPVFDCNTHPPMGSVVNHLDCDDSEDGIRPGAIEICDTIDNDCNGTVDDGLPTTPYYTDTDGDGYGTAPVVARCEDTPPVGLALTQDDCDDGAADVHPDADERCDDIDHDCDGNLFHGALDAVAYYLDLDQDGFGLDATLALTCSPPSVDYVTSGGDCADDNVLRFPGADELCNDTDDDCDGEVDEDAIDVTPFYLDADGDQHGVMDTTLEACDRPAGYAALDDDCNDTNPTIFPGAPELCDELDNDCNASVDDQIQYIDFYPDADDDGFGDANQPPQNACTAPVDTVGNGGDCNDADPQINPIAVETCDGVDTNCSGDESDATDPGLYFQDNDGDDWGDASTLIFACEQPPGTVTTSGDCDDGNAARAPGAIEICDMIDNNCNGVVDTDADTATVWYQDLDSDGSGNPSVSFTTCDQPSGFSQIPGDCDDNEPTVYPGADEICDGQDNDCDGLGDLTDPDGPPIMPYYLDGDADGYGDGAALDACAAPSGYVEVDGDCDDEEDTVYPGAPEECTGIDNNCDGTIDNELGWRDADGDGYGEAGSPTLCNSSSTTADNDEDCDDTDDTIHPAGEEMCGNGVDEDCDGEDAVCDLVDVPATGCKCDAAGSRSGLLVGMLLVLVGLRRRRDAA